MAKRTSLKKSVLIEAPVTAVWQALTDHEMIRQFFFGVETFGEWKEGNTIKFKGGWHGRNFEAKGKVLQMQDQKLLQYSYWSDMSGIPDLPENYHIITYGLSGENGHTRLNVTEENLADEEMKERSGKLWDIVFSNLKNLVEQKKILT